MKMVRRLMDRIRLYKYKRAIQGKSLESVFTSIYKSNIWFSNKESSSGAGSTLAATEIIRAELPQLVESLKCNTLLDIGCGDFNWMREVNLKCKYIGVDIVENLIEFNNSKFGNEKVCFLKINAVDEPLPENCDIVLCREVLFHLSFVEGIKLISNVLRSGARYFIATTNDFILENRDIRTGEFRNINLMMPPYNFPRYSDQILDDKISENRVLAIWDIADFKRRNGDFSILY